MSSQTQSPQFEIPAEAARPQAPFNPDMLPRPVVQETQLSQPEQNLPAMGHSGQPQVQTVPVPHTMHISNAPVTAQPQTVTVSDDMKADDIDVIEKEWVERAKKLLQSTGDDPYLGTHQVSILKAEYMKKRFNRELKLPEQPGVQM